MAVDFYSSITIFLLLLFLPSPSALFFNLSSIGPHDSNNISITGDAYISDQGIQVTPYERSQQLWNKTGHAIYVRPLHLWDRASRNLTDFYTSFDFIISSENNTWYGDGLAFFLAPENSTKSSNVSGGGFGLAGPPGENSSMYRFVAVEFDTYGNVWDPQGTTPGTHVGIDINSVKSVASTTWLNNITQGNENTACITYDSSSRNLSVLFTGIIGGSVQHGHLSYVVDLRDYLPEFVIFGFAAATGDLFERHTVRSWVFNSTLEDPPPPPPPAPPPSENPAPNLVPSNQRRRKNRTGLVVGVTVGPVATVSGLILILCAMWRKRHREEREEEEAVLDLDMDNEFETGPKKFSYKELALCTNNFAEEGKLGEGGFGGVYRGFLRELNSYTAIKRVSRSSQQGIKEYTSEVKIISRLRHRNLVQLIGWCHEKRELLLVYEFMPNGSLDSHLFKERSLLPWATRYKIAQGLASALLYLHEEWEQCVVHRDIKSSNVMLDSNFNAKLGDFGLARLVEHEKGSQTTVLAGTMGYMAPECAVTGRATKESDVYSYGIVALEICCGRKPIDFKVKEDETRIVEWVWKLYGTGELLGAGDLKLCGDFDNPQMERLLIVGLWCAHPDENHRPSIRQSIQVLNFESPPPILPAMLPVPTYFAPPLSSARSYGMSEVSEGVEMQSTSYSTNTISSKYTASSSAS